MLVDVGAVGTVVEGAVYCGGEADVILFCPGVGLPLGGGVWGCYLGCRWCWWWEVLKSVVAVVDGSIDWRGDLIMGVSQWQANEFERRKGLLGFVRVSP